MKEISENIWKENFPAPVRQAQKTKFVFFVIRLF